jgi:PAS domain S-box-containing protein/diguanylate cyclase (GGDEF)-like protein
VNLPSPLVSKILRMLRQKEPAARSGTSVSGETASVPDVLRMRILDLAPVGILVADLRMGQPLIFVNRAFEEITGYAASDALGRNCNYLQGSDRLQPEIQQIRDAISCGAAVSVTLRNYRRDGRLFWNELRLLPLAQAGREPSHYVGFMQDVTHLRVTTEQLDQEVRFDRLTGVLNRSAFVDHVGRLTADPTVRLLLVKMDIAQFQDINSGFGYDVGDALLREVADRLKACAVAAIGRLGPDEFGLAHQLLQDEDPGVKVSLIAASLTHRYVVPGAVVSLRFAIGYTVGEPGADSLVLIRRAGSALHESRQTKLREVRRYDETSEARSRQRIRLATELQSGLGELAFDYQPKVDLATGEMTGAEALLRWKHEIFGLQTPDRFIGLAEDTGLILDIGAWGLRAVADFAAKVNQGRGRPLRFAVNVSPVEFVHRDMVSFVARVLEESGADPGWLTLELTESLLAELSPRILEMFRALRGLGIGLSLDDFGTGYSNLHYLETFPMTEIKLDRGFVQGISCSGSKRIIVEAVTRLGRELQVDVVAEGVETAAELSTLRALGCLYGQGYLFSRPIPPDALAALAESDSLLAPRP